jgi:hypothetical protein
VNERVLSTGQAIAAVEKMQSILSGSLLQEVQQLELQGETLCDPSVWDGRAAADFRSSIWPQAKTTLDRTVSTLEELRTAVQRVIRDIQVAGGNG